MAASVSFTFGVLLLCANLFTPSSCNGGHSRLPENHVALFIFGDSLFDPGNNNYVNCGISNQANFSPYGETFFKYPTGRFCDGRVVPDFIAEFAKLPLIPGFLQPGLNQFTNGANFASGGAGTLAETHPGTEIYKKGGRKFGFQNAAPMGCIPATLRRENSSECVQEESAKGKLHNIALSKAIRKLESQLEGFKYSIFDYYTSLYLLTNYPSKYGFKEGKIACCGSGAFMGFNSCGGKRGIKEYHLCSNSSEHVWFDFAHTSESANRHLAQLMWSGTPKVTKPCNVKALFEML